MGNLDFYIKNNYFSQSFEPQNFFNRKKTIIMSDHSHNEKKNQEEYSIHFSNENESNKSSHLPNLNEWDLLKLLDTSEKIINKDDIGKDISFFIQIKKRIHDIFLNENLGSNPENEKHLVKYKGIERVFNEKLVIYNKNQEGHQQKNLEEKLEIIERLKKLYTQSTSKTNYFKEIRTIKEDWANCGQVSKTDYKNLNNNYFHHLNQFYQMLEYNKEYRELEYNHNLEKRRNILRRAQELLEEPSVQKALNELQYLHKLWKEEAEPVAEEFKESTWDEFKDISNRIHDRKSELIAQLDENKLQNLERKNNIIQEIKNYVSSDSDKHSFWNLAMKKVDDLRAEFLKIGSVPKADSVKNWHEFKNSLKEFNSAKNSFFKSVKNVQITNLQIKKELIQIAKDNMLSEDWDTTTPIFKKLQEDWKKVGHVPRSQANVLWDEFKEACNTFFDNFRSKTDAQNNDWKQNFIKKESLLEQLKIIQNEEGDIEKINQLKNDWNAIGKVPKEKMGINSSFNKILKEKLKLNKINEYDLADEHLSGNQITEKARKIKNQISDLETEISKLENNLSFFKNPSESNPLLKDSFVKINDKKAELKSLKESLHRIISEN